MAVALALTAAIGWGASDYFGGDALRRATSVFTVVAATEFLGFVLLVPALIARGVAPPLSTRLMLALVAGVAVTVELSLIYRALSQGLAFITAPTGALGTAAAVAVGLIAGDPVGVMAGVGLGCALVGGAISAWDPSGTRASGRTGTWRPVIVCLGAASALGVMLTSLHAAGRLDPYWATAAEHLSTCVTAGLAAFVAGRRRWRAVVPGRPQLPVLGLIAMVGVGGDLAYTSASRGGALSIVSAISSLYPVVTIALGRLLQSHRATRSQIVGIALALGGATLLGAASG